MQTLQNSLAMHLLKIAGCVLSWWTYKNIATERPVLYHSLVFFFVLSWPALIDRCCFSFTFFLLWMSVQSHSAHILQYDTITVQRHAVPPLFTNIQGWPLLALAPGYRDVHHGPLPQALRFLGGRCLQGDSDQTGSMHSYQSSCTLFVQFCVKANNYTQFIYTIMYVA